MRFGERCIPVSNVNVTGRKRKRKIFSPVVKISLISTARHLPGEVFLSYIGNKTPLNQNFSVWVVRKTQPQGFLVLDTNKILAFNPERQIICSTSRAVCTTSSHVLRYQCSVIHKMCQNQQIQLALSLSIS